jgi:hypothetical protein
MEWRKLWIKSKGTEETLNQNRMEEWRKLRIRIEWRNGGHFGSKSNGGKEETWNQKRMEWRGRNLEAESDGMEETWNQKRMEGIGEASNQKPMEWRKLRIRIEWEGGNFESEWNGMEENFELSEANGEEARDRTRI